MADVIVAPQGVRGIIRFECGAIRIFRFVMKRIFIRIDKIRILFANRPHDLKQRRRMKQIVMVE